MEPVKFMASLGIHRKITSCFNHNSRAIYDKIK